MVAVAWDVPVRLVPQSARKVPRSTFRVDAGIALPGVGALEATTVAVDDGTLLERLVPVPAGSVAGADGAAAPPLPSLASLLTRLRTDGAVPVAFDGTPFMLAVLEALTRVAAGTTCTYAELAAAAGRPSAVRAAATVMANNRVPLVLPCHRVVPAAGGTGRYGWGADAKAALLAAEARP
jgi:methylated-DNA-[protein]-cysteine S-methyltransferase